jgi:glucose/arabinose dehydrogenase
VHRLTRSLALALLLFGACAGGAKAATLTSIGEFDQPIYVASDPGNPSRLFVVEREGRVAEVVNGGAPRPYADLTSLVACCESERGLLSIALAPDFDTSGRFYAAYAGKPAAGGSLGDIHVDSFAAAGPGELSRTPLLTVPHSQQANHNGGQLQFGPDGYLYISVGDGGGGGDPFLSGQSTGTLLGKILRVDPHPGSTPPYSIPPGNPFASSPGDAEEIWAYGLRNPWRFSFDSLTGDMVIGDVGQNEHEEVDFAPSPSAGVVGGGGANYGWSCREGFSPYTDSTPAPDCGGVSFTEPVFDYPHSGAAAGEAEGCAITGGYVVRDPSLGDLYGRYLYADYCAGEIRSLQLPTTAVGLATDRSEGIEVSNPESFGEDSCHRIYVVAGSEVLRFEGATPAACPPPEEEAGPPSVPPATERKPVAAEGPGPGPSLPAVPRRLAIAERGRSSRGLGLVVSIRPCLTDGDRDYAVLLNRGGRRVGSAARLGRGCRAVFLVKGVSPPATFRALATPLVGGPRLRSARFLLARP